MQIDRGAEHDVNLLRHGLLGQQLTDLVRGLLAPRGGQQRGVGEQRDCAPAAELQPADSRGTVGEAQLAEADGLPRRTG